MAVGSAGQSPFGGHAGPVRSVAFQPGGFSVATGGEDGTIRIWDASSGEQREQFTGHSGPVNSVVYSPDGAVIASAGRDRTIRIWDAGTGEQRAQLTGHTGSVRSVAYNQGGTAIASAGEDRTVRLWHAITGEPLQYLQAQMALNAVAFSPDGNLIAYAGSDRAVWLWRMLDGSAPRRLTEHLSAVNTVAFSPDGKMLASAGGDRTVRICNVPTGREQAAWQADLVTVNAVAFSSDGNSLASAGGDRSVVIWDVGTWKSTSQLVGHSRSVNCVVYNVSGAAAAIASASDDGTARIWDVLSARERQPFAGHTGLVNLVAYSPDGETIATAGADGNVRAWADRTGDPQPLLAAHIEPVTTMAYSPLGRTMVTVDESAAVRIWDLATGQAQKLDTVHDKSVRAVAFKPDGSSFATAGDDGAILIWDASGSHHGRKLTDRAGPINSVAYAVDGTLISGGRDGIVRVWDTDAERVQNRLRGNLAEVLVVACSPRPDSHVVAAADSDGTILIGDVATDEQLARIAGHSGPVYSMAFEPAGSAIATAGGDGVVKIWDSNTFAQQGQLTGHTSGVRSVAYSPDGAAIATCGYDGTIREWDARTGDQISGSGFGVRRTRQLHLAGVSSDSPSAVDLIGVGRDVDTLSELIAATETRAPLAIALIGEWGAGKSSVLKLVDAHVERLVEMSRNNRGATAFATSICQIHFNAWHYSSDHLWAGVVRNLFQALYGSGWRDAPSETASDIAKIRAERVKRRKELDECEKATERLTTELDRTRSAKPPSGLLGVLGSPSYVLRTFAYTYREGIADLRTSKLLVLGWAALGTIAAGVWFFFGSQIRIGVAVTAGVLASMLPIFRRIRLLHQMLIDDTNTLYHQLERKRDDLEQRTAEAERQLSLVDAQFRLSEFVRDRGNSKIYRAGEGLVGDVHEDLLVLSEKLQQARREWTAADGQPEPPERIVLYIDDLDRCPPGRVVEMLEAVNLILTMDLFVVVVAVDARWMIRSLQSHYSEFFDGSDGNGTGDGIRTAVDGDWIAPYDYLDKIFQIPYTLVPPGNSKSARYLRALLPEPWLTGTPRLPANSTGEQTGFTETQVASKTGLSPSDRRAGGRKASENAGRQSGGPVNSPATAADQEAAANEPVEPSTGSRTVTDLQPPSLRLNHAEVEFMTRLGTLTPSPRAAKRMANLYRLVRISISDAELARFLGDASGGPYRVVQVLLAILTGNPDNAHELFERILHAGGDDSLLDVLGSGAGKSQDDRHSMAQIGAKLRRLNDESGLPLRVCEYQKWCPQLARYSFRTWRLARELAGRDGELGRQGDAK